MIYDRKLTFKQNKGSIFPLYTGEYFTLDEDEELLSWCFCPEIFFDNMVTWNCEHRGLCFLAQRFSVQFANTRSQQLPSTKGW